MKIINCLGVIVGDNQKAIYEYLGYKAVSPKDFKDGLQEANGEPVTVLINSPGGSIYAASEIYTDLRSYRGIVTTQIQGMAASAASYIAVAGECEISPTAQMMIHNVTGGINGDYRSMEHMAEVLKKANKSIANAYIVKTGIPEGQLLQMMDNETWFTAQEAVEKGFANRIMFADSSLSDRQKEIRDRQNKSKENTERVLLQAKLDLLKAKARIL